MRAFFWMDFWWKLKSYNFQNFKTMTLKFFIFQGVDSEFLRSEGQHYMHCTTSLVMMLDKL